MKTGNPTKSNRRPLKYDKGGAGAGFGSNVFSILMLVVVCAIVTNYIHRVVQECVGN